MPYALIDFYWMRRYKGEDKIQRYIPLSKQGEEGQRMLVDLRDWWQNGINDIGVLRLDAISPIPGGISLIEAEMIARNREPGDGSQQRDMVEQINAVFAMVDKV